MNALMFAASPRTAFLLYVPRTGFPLCLFQVMVPPQGEPLWDFAYPMLGGPIDPKISDINQKIDYSLSVVGWPMHPTVLRDSAKCVLQDICNRYSSRPLTNAQNGRVQQFVTKVNVYCWYKALPALPVTWVLQPRFDGI